MRRIVKGFGRRPIATVGAGIGAVVGKPPRKEPAGSRGKEGAARYGDLTLAWRMAEAVKA
jgi:hypothetical protein